MDRSSAAGNLDTLLALAGTLARRMQAGNQRAWLDLHISLPQLKLLHLLVTSGSQSPGALAEALRVSPATVTGLCDGLVERGLAVRESNPPDRRSNRVVATGEGQRLVTDLAASQREQWTTIMEALSEEEQALVAEAFRALLRAIERADRPEQKPCRPTY